MNRRDANAMGIICLFPVMTQSLGFWLSIQWKSISLIHCGVKIDGWFSKKRNYYWYDDDDDDVDDDEPVGVALFSSRRRITSLIWILIFYEFNLKDMNSPLNSISMNSPHFEHISIYIINVCISYLVQLFLDKSIKR